MIHGILVGFLLFMINYNIEYSITRHSSFSIYCKNSDEIHPCKFQIIAFIKTFISRQFLEHFIKEKELEFLLFLPGVYGVYIRNSNTQQSHSLTRVRS